MPDPLDAAFDSFERSAARLETLPDYADDEDQAALQRFLAGDASLGSHPTDWSKFVEELTNHGKTVRRIRVVTKPLTDYLRYELSAGYQPGARAGEEIRVYVDEASSVTREDFWLFDDRVLVSMQYSKSGEYQGSVVRSDESQVAQARLLFERLWTQAIPLAAFHLT